MRALSCPPTPPRSRLPIRGRRFRSGSGQLDEEILDDEESDSSTLHASSIEEIDDLEEETLEGAADLGTMLREMSIDHITRTAPDVEEEEPPWAWLPLIPASNNNVMPFAST